MSGFRSAVAISGTFGFISSTSASISAKSLERMERYSFGLVVFLILNQDSNTMKKIAFAAAAAAAALISRPGGAFDAVLCTSSLPATD
jgi:hypothetical protein